VKEEVMQDFENFQELSDQDLENVAGGHKNHSFSAPVTTTTDPSSTSVGSGVSVGAYGTGGKFGFDGAITKTVSETIVESNGEGLSISFGFAVGYAF
jgi:hypothetical protein